MGLLIYMYSFNFYSKDMDYALRKVNPSVKAVFDFHDMKPWLYEKFYLIHLIKK